MRPLLPLALAAASCAFLTTACAQEAPESSTSTSAPASSQVATHAASPAASASSAAATAASSAATGAASASTGGSSATATDSPGTTASAAVPALVQQYCTQAQKVCFSYPADYKVVTATTNTGGLVGEQGHVENPQGVAVFYFADGISGVGGTCDQASQKDQQVVTSVPTQITNVPVTSATDGTAVNVVQAVIQPVSGSGYVAQEYLTHTKQFLTTGTVTACGEGFSDLILLSGNKGSVHAGVYQFGDTNEQHYATAEEAQQALTSSTYALAAAMLQTVTIG